MVLKRIECGKESTARSFIGALLCRKTGLVNSVIDILVNERRDLRMLRFKIGREQIDSRISKLPEDIVEHSADVIFGIVYDLPLLLIPKHWNRDAPVEPGICSFISLG